MIYYGENEKKCLVPNGSSYYSYCFGNYEVSKLTPEAMMPFDVDGLIKTFKKYFTSVMSRSPLNKLLLVILKLMLSEAVASWGGEVNIYIFVFTENNLFLKEMVRKTKYINIPSSQSDLTQLRLLFIKACDYLLFGVDIAILV